MSDIETDEVARILAMLPPKDAAYLAQRLQPAWQRRARKLDGRDKTVRDAAAFFGDPTADLTRVAKAIARELDRYLAAAWRHGQALTELPPEVPRLRAALHRIAVANSGRSIGWRQIVNILRGRRGG